jgi:type I restriction enzyme S subunit
MDAKRFLAEFKHIASAPSSVQRLRQMIYNLAITGDLTQQLADDGDAESLLRDIERAKARLIEEKAFKRSPKLENQPLLPPANIKLADSWRWSRLVDIGEINPKNKAADDTLASFISMSGVPQIHSGSLEAEQYPWGQIKKGFTHFADGDVVLAKITPCFENGKAAVVTGLTNGIGAGTTELHVVRPLHGLIEPGYVYIFLRSPYFTAEGENNMTGTAGQKRLPTEYFATRLLPLPPIAEQKRIVAKVDELMALCDKLEAQQQEREALGKRTRLSTLNVLATAGTMNELKTAWRRLQENFSLLLGAPSSVDDFYMIVRELALKGLLSASDDETVDGLLEAIAERKKGKRIARLQAATLLFDIPKGWRWVLLEDLLHDSDSGWSPKCEPSPREQDEWGVLKVSAVTWGQFQPKENKRLSSAFTPAIEAEVKPGDFLLSRANTAELVARSVITPEDCPKHLMMSDKIVRLNFIDDRLKPWVNLVNNSRFARKYYIANATGTSDSMKNVSRQMIHELAIPLPPLATQLKLIAAAGKLESLCESLKRQMTQASATSRDFTIACIAAITGIRIEEKEKMKAPKTELVSNLRIGEVRPTNTENAPLTTILVRHKELSAKTLWNTSGLEIGPFYQQLKTEMEKGWIVQPEVAYVKVVEAS